MWFLFLRKVCFGETRALRRVPLRSLRRIGGASSASLAQQGVAEIRSQRSLNFLHDRIDLRQIIRG
jgi:hypothetical protein